MGEAAERVATALRERLAAARPGFAWETEYRVGRTPVDVAGVGDDALVLVELEWRRADPVDNPVKLFRHVDSGRVDADRVLLVQAFTRYYDLADGDVSAKRKNAEFAGRTVAEAVDRVDYRGVTLAVDPPRGDADPPAGWQEAVDALVETVVGAVDGDGGDGCDAHEPDSEVDS